MGGKLINSVIPGFLSPGIRSGLEKWCLHQNRIHQRTPWKSKDYLLNGFSEKTIILVGIYNQQFQGTIILMVFDLQGTDFSTVDGSESRRENHLTCKKPVVNNGKNYHINWCRILSINSSTESAGNPESKKSGYFLELPYHISRIHTAYMLSFRIPLF